MPCSGPIWVSTQFDFVTVDSEAELGFFFFTELLVVALVLDGGAALGFGAGLVLRYLDVAIQAINVIKFAVGADVIGIGH
jgi:hypothetical protein